MFKLSVHVLLVSVDKLNDERDDEHRCVEERIRQLEGVEGEGRVVGRLNARDDIVGGVEELLLALVPDGALEEQNVLRLLDLESFTHG